MNNPSTLGRDSLDEETRYVLEHYHRLLNPLEVRVLNYVGARCPSLHEPTEAEREECGFCDETYHYRTDAAFMAIVRSNGLLPFLAAARDRLLTDHRSEIVMNRCPRCNRLCRTPKARQCFLCGHDWH
jgi:hypothetical protein